MMAKNLIALLLIFTGILTYSQQTNKVKALDSMIRTGMEDWKIPGLSTVVVKDGEVVFKKTYGVNNLNTDEEVNDNTLFNMGSTTKAMVAMAMGILVDQGKVKWNDKVQKYLSDFELSDPYISSDARVVDLFTHNLGMANADLLWVMDSTSSKDIVKRLKYTKKAYPVRSGFIYQNIMYVVAGEIIEKISGQHWSDFIKENLFWPLEMNRTQSRSVDIFKAGNYVSPHYENEQGEAYRVDHSLSDQIGAAGLIWTTNNDVANYLKFLTNDGVFKQDTILKPETFKYLFEPKTILPPNARYPTNVLSNPQFNSYAMGWFQQDYKGVKLDFHTGSLNGLIAIAGIMQDKGVAVYVMANMDHAELRHAILYKAIDLFAFDDDSRDWHKEVFELYKEEERNTQNSEPFKDEKSKPSLSLDSYTGQYTNEYLGTIKVRASNETLNIIVNEKIKGVLDHLNKNNFRAKNLGKFNVSTVINFQFNDSDSVKSLRAFGETFTKI